MKTKYQIYGLALLTLISVISCRKLVETPAPSTSLNAENAFGEDATAIGIQTGVYAIVSGYDVQDGHFNNGLTLAGGVSADEFKLMSGNVLQPLYINNLTANNSTTKGYWNDAYNVVYKENAVIEGVTGSTKLTPAVKQQLLGEAYLMRAYTYFYLTNLYGDVPIAMTSDYKTNQSLTRSPQKLVFQQVIADLLQAKSLLSKTFLNGTLLAADPERVRPTYWAALALLSRVYLYYGYVNGNDNAQFQQASDAATELISHSELFSLSKLDTVFLKASLGNNEAIWQIQPVQTGWDTQEAQAFIIPSTGPDFTHPVWLSDSLLKAFEAGDKRRTEWIDSITIGAATYHYPYKYKAGATYDPTITNAAAMTEYQMQLRLSEQYLIRAEAKAKLGDMPGATADLNVIRNRAGLPNSTATTQDAVLAAILHENQVEFFAEFGHRWLDLKRTGMLDKVMGSGGASAAKSGSWAAYKALFPIPQYDLQWDSNLTQNAGY